MESKNLKASALFRSRGIYAGIIILILGLFIPVIIHGLLESRGEEIFFRCLDELHSIQIANEMYISDHGSYAPNLDLLADYLFRLCEMSCDEDCIEKAENMLAKRIYKQEVCELPDHA